MTGWAIIGAAALIATMAGGEVWAENGARDYIHIRQLWIFGIVLSGLCYLSYRNPEKHMASTPREKYNLGFILYLTIAIFSYILLAVFPELLLAVYPDLFSNLKNLGKFNILPNNEIFKGLAEYLPAFVALITILTLVRFQPARRWHEKLLTNIRTLVNIPVEQALLAAQLRQGTYELLSNTPVDIPKDGNAPNISPNVEADEWLSDKVKLALRNDLVDKKDWEFEVSDSLNYDWAKAISLFYRYEKAFSKYLAYSRIFPSQFEERDEKFKELRGEVPKFIIEVRTFLDKYPDVKRGSSKEHKLIKEQFGEKLTALRDDRITPFLESLYEDFAGIVYRCSSTPIGRKKIIKEFGFDHTLRMRDLSVPLGLTCFFLLLITVIIFPTVAPVSANKLVGAARFFCFELSAVIIAILVADQYLANRSDSPLIGGWVHLEEYMKPLAKASIYSLIVGLLLNFVIESLRPGEFNIGTYALVLVPAMTAVTLTFLNIQRSYLILQKWWLEGAILAVAIVLAFSVAIYSLIPLIVDKSVENVPYKLVLIFGPLIGFAIGCIVPSWSRQKQSELKTLS